MRYELISSDGRRLSSTLTESDIELVSRIGIESILLNTKTRGGKITNSDGTIIALSNDPDLVKSSQKFKSTARVLLEAIKYIYEIAAEQKEVSNKNIARLIHNLTSLNAHNIQEIYSLISQDELSGRARGHIEHIKKTIQQNPYEASKALLRIAKNNAAMKAEFSVFKKLFIARPELWPSNHVMHKVLMNVVYLFFPDFTDKNVEVTVEPSTAVGFFDYESMHVALYHLIDNAAKYTKPASKVHINITHTLSWLSITFKMESTKISDDEVGNIFDEGYSGKAAISAEKAGDGIGMNIVKRIIESNGGAITLNVKDGTPYQFDGIEYGINEFIITIPSSKEKRTKVRSSRSN